jgi:hypothetical protein
VATTVDQARSAQIAAMPPLARTAALVRSDITAETIRAVKKLWTGHGVMHPHVWMGYYGDHFYRQVATAQLEAATVATLTVDPLLEEQGYTGGEDINLAPESLAGIDGTGRDDLGLAYAASLPVAAALDTDLPAPETYALWARAGQTLLLATHTAVLDASRVAKGVQITSRDNAGWIRMVRPPCCSRCAILAGRIYDGGGAFKRHPNCDCDAVPVHDYLNRHNDPSLDGWVFDTREYFHSLPEAQQNKIFTKAGAEAIRDGADPAQVVNARRGMASAVDRFGTTRKVTYESTTSRGWASQYLRQQYDTKLTKQGRRYRETQRRRLMPEEIYRIAGGDRDQALAMLHANGYLDDTSPNLSGLRLRDAEVQAAKARAGQRLIRRGAPAEVVKKRQRVNHRSPPTVIDTTPSRAADARGTRDYRERVTTSPGQLAKATSRASTMVRDVLPDHVSIPVSEIVLFKKDRFGTPAQESTVRASTNLDTRVIEVNPTLQGQEATIIHELGHLLDRDLDQAGRTKYTKALDQIKRSETVRALEDHPQKSLTDPIHKRYLLQDREVFARAFAQYVATESKSPKVVNTIDFHRGGEGMDGLQQWPDDDFDEFVRPALKEFLESL